MAKEIGFKNDESWKSCFKSEYLGSDDLPGRKDMILTIVGVTKAEVSSDGRNKDYRPILHFAEGVKPMICNATNAKTISTLAGSSLPNNWVDTKIQVYIKDGIHAFGQIVDALRIRPYAPKVPTKPVLKEGTEAFKNAQAYINSGHTVEEIETKYAISAATKKLLENGK